MIISLDKYKATGGGIKVEGDIAISENGIYDVTTYATANVNVATKKSNYYVFDGDVDVNGLRAIGWDAASIGMFRDNSLHYSWQNDDYIVSEENKALYGVIVDKNSIQNNKDNPNFKFCPFFNTSNVTSMFDMFNDCTSLISIPQLDTSNVTSMGMMFRYCASLTSIPQLDTSNVTGMGYMFDGCASLTSIPQLDTSNVKSMMYTFHNCDLLTSIPQLDTSNVTNMGSLFSGCKSLTSISQLDTSNVTDISNMFNSCSSLTSIPQLDTSNVTKMNNVFDNCKSLTSISQLDTSNVITMNGMFRDCASLTSIPQLDTTKVTNISWMFAGCTSLVSIPQLDTSNVTTTSYFFGFYTINTLTDLGGFKNLSVSITSNFLDKCPNLTVDSLMNVINNLATVSGKTLAFGSTNLNKLTAEQISIATDKGWTLT